ncbi:transcriptional regulator family: Fungal Specific TF [Paecilomyces variotii]|nr:transcriptional regulator family: Fungal Specific TF [Paecilomyces variotii]KAJ9335558.1 transcriptional regulator family: Fungal Specific TF [Paecilomyces variotii]
MQQESERPKKAPRKHVTTACVPCRESKIRCDGATPNCHNCQKKGKECRYQHGDDKRKVSLRAATELFSMRIDELCQYIYDKGLEPPPMKPEDEAAMNRVLDTLQIPRGQAQKRRGSSKPTDATDTLSSAFPLSSNLSNNTLPIVPRVGGMDSQPSSVAPTSNKLTLPATSGRDSGLGMIGGFESQLGTSNWNFALPNAESLDSIYANIDRASSGSADTSGVMSPESLPLGQELPQLSGSALGQGQTDPFSETDSGDEAENEVIEQLSSRLGTLKIAGDGHLRYYGPTSNLNLIDVSPTEQRPRPDTRTVRQDGQEILNHLRIGQAVDQALEDHFVELYFAWQNTSSHVVDREVFLEARSKWRNEYDDTPFYSEVLTNAMCALGSAFEARYHPTFITFPKSLSEFFADRAKTLLEIELDSPCVATVQALAILSSHEAASNRDARGWLYSGMSMRLAFDLGLHIDMSPYVKKGDLSERDAEVRGMAFWGSYIADHFWGFYLGRPFRMNAGDITVPKPASHPSKTRVETWYPYGASDSSNVPKVGLRSPTDLITRQFVLLWEMISPVGHILYGCANIPKHDLQRLNYKVTEDLFAWKRNLPSELQIDLDNDTAPQLPHLLMLHMQYHQIVIFFHRPWVSKSYIQPSNPRQGPGYLHARRMCIESATAVAKLLRLYEKYYTFRRINNQVVAIIFTAALMLIFVTISTSTQSPGRTSGISKPEMVAHLNVCFRALDELGQSFDNAKRTRDFLVSLQRRWQNRMRKSGSAAKRLLSSSQIGPHINKGPNPVSQEADPSESRKRFRSSVSNVNQEAAIPSSSTVPVASAGALPRHQQPPSQPQPQQQTLPPDSVDMEWLRNSDLRVLSDDLSDGLYQQQATFDTTPPLPSLADIEPWWDSPNAAFGRSSFDGT